MASAASRIFSDAAEQSCTQTSLFSPFLVSPQTMMAAAAFGSIFVYGLECASVSKTARSVTATNAQGRLSAAVGAAMPARSRISICSFVTGLSRYVRTLCGCG